MSDNAVEVLVVPHKVLQTKVGYEIYKGLMEFMQGQTHTFWGEGREKEPAYYWEDVKRYLKYRESSARLSYKAIEKELKVLKV